VSGKTGTMELIMNHHEGVQTEQLGTNSKTTPDFEIITGLHWRPFHWHRASCQLLHCEMRPGSHMIVHHNLECTVEANEVKNIHDCIFHPPRMVSGEAGSDHSQSAIPEHKRCLPRPDKSHVLIEEWSSNNPRSAKLKTQIGIGHPSGS